MKKHYFENLPQRKPNTKSTIYTDKFEKWLEKAKSDGLEYVNIFYAEGQNQFNVKYEDFCEEFIRMKEAPEVEDKEIF